MELIEIESVKNGMWMSLIDALQEDVTEKMLICRRREIICQDNVIASGPPGLCIYWGSWADGGWPN